MRTPTLKSIAKRGSLLGAAFALTVAAIAPALPTYADALNPLTDRSLTLSSSSPGWDYKDGSGNATYAPPNSGANGQKTGNTFDFKVSTDSTASGTNEPIKGITFQYCTTSAGDCLGPGNNGWTGSSPSATRNADSSTTTDLNVVVASPSQIPQASLSTYVNTSTGVVTSIPAASSTGTNYIVMYNNAGTWTSSDGWTMTTAESQYGAEGDLESTGANNQIKLVNSTGQGFTSGQEIKIVFFGTDTNYITNPGSGAFFVRINTYNSDSTLNSTTVVDGGVTVANVMNHSIQIITKVLETMDFSVGTVDPYTLTATGSAGSQLELAYPGHNLHGTCDPILKGMLPTDAINTLYMGNANGEFSLETGKTYSTHSYWRLSSNSSAGATVYYAGQTLSNTVGDQIDPMPTTATAPIEGSEQFGLALDNGSSGVYAVNYAVERDGTNNFENAADNATSDDGTPGVDASVTADGVSNLDANPSWHSPQLSPLTPTTQYGDGTGVINSEYGTIDTSFAFDTGSNLIPVAIATENSQVVDCVTGKMRYVANIAATTPAGIYTTKINYIAAPQY